MKNNNSKTIENRFEIFLDVLFWLLLFKKILKDEFSNIFLNNKSQKSTSKNILKVLYEE